jgi:hypothetical protein
VTWRIPMADRRAARAEGVPLRRWLRWAAGSSVFSHVAWDDPMPVIRGKVLPRLARR